MKSSFILFSYGPWPCRVLPAQEKVVLKLTGPGFVLGNSNFPREGIWNLET